MKDKKIGRLGAMSLAGVSLPSFSDSVEVQGLSQPPPDVGGYRGEKKLRSAHAVHRAKQRSELSRVASDVRKWLTFPEAVPLYDDKTRWAQKRETEVTQNILADGFAHRQQLGCQRVP